MPKFILTGGRQRKSFRGLPEWALFDQAVIAELDTDSGRVQTRFRYESPPEARPDPGSHVFKAGAVEGRDLWVVTQTEVLRLQLPDYQLVETISLPEFNDLHHVLPGADGLDVVSTGLDCLVQLDPERRVCARRHALGDSVEEKFDLQRDWRLVATTKPHAAHPNYCFRTAHGTWLTRFEQRDAVCLDEPSRRLAIEVGNPHDGLVRDGRVWFTTTNGHLVECDSEAAETVRRIDLNKAAATDVPLGWCRGLHMDGDLAFIGFSRIRHTKIRKNLSWVRHGFKLPDGLRYPPTRIAAFDLREERFVEEWDVEAADLGALFSVLPLPEK